MEKGWKGNGPGLGPRAHPGPRARAPDYGPIRAITGPWPREQGVEDILLASRAAKSEPSEHTYESWRRGVDEAHHGDDEHHGYEKHHGYG